MRGIFTQKMCEEFTPVVKGNLISQVYFTPYNYLLSLGLTARQRSQVVDFFHCFVLTECQLTFEGKSGAKRKRCNQRERRRKRETPQTKCELNMKPRSSLKGKMNKYVQSILELKSGPLVHFVLSLFRLHSTIP